jgi:hypothetical protein
MKEHGTASRSVDQAYEAAARQMRRFGVSKIASRMMNGRRIWFPADWDRAERRTPREERERRLEEIRRTL